MSKRNKNRYGEKKNTGVWLDDHMLKTDAWKAARPISRALYVCFRQRMGHPERNGRVAYSAREMARDLGVTEKTSHGAALDLLDKGFLKIKTKGAFTIKAKHATEWILTEWPLLGALDGTKEYRTWKPPENSEHGGKISHRRRENLPPGATTRTEILPPSAGKSPTVRVICEPASVVKTPTLISSHTPSAGRGGARSQERRRADRAGDDPLKDLSSDERTTAADMQARLEALIGDVANKKKIGGAAE